MIDTIFLFIRVEVENQGFDISTTDGMNRIIWMKQAWDYAQFRIWESRFPTYDDIMNLGKIIEPDKVDGIRISPVINNVTLRQMGVGTGQIRRNLNALVDAFPVLTSDEAYREFEEIHPFVDGNGRVGKVIYNWHADTLALPKFPPDFFEIGVP